MTAVFLQFPPTLFSSAAVVQCWRLVLLTGPVSPAHCVPFQVHNVNITECDKISNIWYFTSFCFSACVLTDNAPHEILSCWINYTAYRRRCSNSAWGSWAPSTPWPLFCLEKLSCPCTYLSSPCLSPCLWLGIRIPLQHSASEFVDENSHLLW